MTTPGSQTSSFKDHFSGHAAAYSTFRPTYPASLFAFLADCCTRREHAWDCATGNGQTATALVEHFTRITATDASAEQVRAAPRHARIDYRVASAEQSGLDDDCVDLVTVSQALHWFDIDRFFEEAQRVLVADGVLAVWSYELCRAGPRVDDVIARLYEALDEYWPPERRLVEDRYQGIQMPMPAIAAPEFLMKARWQVDDMLGYLRTWSACQRCLKATAVDPVETVEADLRSAWGAGERDVSWPLALRIGRSAG